MSTVKHSPGPWYPRHNLTTDTSAPFEVRTEDETIVARCGFARSAEPIFRATAAANVQLIAAAPEMLERLKESTGWLDAERGRIVSEIEGCADFVTRSGLEQRLRFLDAHRQNVTAAIIKAEGAS